MNDASNTNWPTKTHCACGGVTLELAAKPLSMFLCSCHDCQKASGTGHAPLALFHKEHVKIDGETKGFEVTAASGARVTRNFCPTCGTPLYGETQRQPSLRLVPAGIFEHSQWFKPSSMIFYRTHNHWDELPPDLPTYSTYKEKQDA